MGKTKFTEFQNRDRTYLICKQADLDRRCTKHLFYEYCRINVTISIWLAQRVGKMMLTLRSYWLPEPTRQNGSILPARDYPRFSLKLVVAVAGGSRTEILRASKCFIRLTCQSVTSINFIIYPSDDKEVRVLNWFPLGYST